MHEQYVVIEKNLKSQNNPDKDYWIRKLQKNVRLADMIDGLNLAMLCLYPHDVYKKMINEELGDEQRLDYHRTNIRELKAYFDSINDCVHKDKVNIVLLLFPVKDKKEFVKKLHEKLWYAQQL